MDEGGRKELIEVYSQAKTTNFFLTQIMLLLKIMNGKLHFFKLFSLQYYLLKVIISLSISCLTPFLILDPSYFWFHLFMHILFEKQHMNEKKSRYNDFIKMSVNDFYWVVQWLLLPKIFLSLILLNFFSYFSSKSFFLLQFYFYFELVWCCLLCLIYLQTTLQLTLFIAIINELCNMQPHCISNPKCSKW